MTEWGPGTNTGHGHVWPRPDGRFAKCFGLPECRVCAADAARLAGQAVPALRWKPHDADISPEGTAGITALSGHCGAECVARVVHTRGGWLWDVFVGRDAGGTADTPDAAKAAAQDAWAAWCERAGLVPAAELDALKADMERLMEGMCEPAGDAADAPGEGKLSGYKEAGQVRDAAALVDAAAPVIWRGMLNANNQLDFSGAHAKRTAAAGLAPALRELARQARCDDGRDTMGVGAWLDGLADALDARGVTP